MRTRARRYIIALASGASLTALTVAGCSGGSTTTETGDPAQISTTTTALQVVLTEDQKAAIQQQALLTANDLGDGWHETLDDHRALDADTFSFLLAEPSCEKVVANIAKNEGSTKVQSPRFENDTYTAQNSATLFDKQRNAERLVAQISKDSAQECLSKAFDAGFRREHAKAPLLPDSEISSIRVRKLPYLPLGDLAVGFEVTIDFVAAEPAKGPSGTAEKDPDKAVRSLKIARYAVQQGPTIIDFTFSSKQYTFPETERVAKPVIDRVDTIMHPAGRAPISSTTSTTAAP